jgi:hypothetical protein
MIPPQILDSFLVIRFWGVEANAAGLPAIIALSLILVLFIFMRGRKRR